MIIPDLLGAWPNPDEVTELELLDIISGFFGHFADLVGQGLVIAFHKRQIVEVIEAAEEHYPIAKTARVTPSLVLNELLDALQDLGSLSTRSDIPVIFKRMPVNGAQPQIALLGQPF